MIQRIREKHKPKRVRVLFIGEAPPANGRFFYSLPETQLLRHTRGAFEEAYGREWSSPEEFLRFFKEEGFYLDDLCHEPIDHLDRKDRRAKRREAVASLRERIREMRPSSIIVIMKGIERYVKVSSHSLPFPSHGHQLKYKERLVEILTSLRKEET